MKSLFSHSIGKTPDLCVCTANVVGEDTGFFNKTRSKEYSMKNVFKLFGIIALAAIIGFSMAACGGDDDGGGPQTATYTGKSGNDTYTLKITENTARYSAQSGDAYELIFGTKKSTGTVNSVSGGTLNLQPSNALLAIFIAIISGNNLSALNGTITWTDNTTSPAPGELTTGGNQGGGNNANIVGTWKSSDGIDTYIFTANNKYTLDKSRGGGSIIDEEGTYTVSGNTVKMHDSDGPYTRTGTVNGNSMRIIHDQYTWSDVTVYKQ